MRINGFVKGMATLLVVGACIGGKIQMGHNEDKELERIKTEHIDETMKAYGEYAKAYNEAERALYADSLASIAADSAYKSVKDSVSNPIRTQDLNIQTEK